MANKKASKNWEKYGAQDPYYGVLSHDEFHSDNTRDQFFSSDEKYIEDVVGRIKDYF